MATMERQHSNGERLEAPAALRNRQPIMEVLERHLPKAGTVLEIASGSGQHIVAFCRRYPHLAWQPSDPDPQARRSIAAWAEHEDLAIGTPLDIDTRDDHWPTEHLDDIVAVIAINMVHISPWASTVGLFRGAADRLAGGGLVYLYGPYQIDGAHTAPSNAAFDHSLKSRDPSWGVRDRDEVADVAREYGFRLIETVAMPNNNFSLIFRRDG